MWIKHRTKHKFLRNFIRQIWQTFKCSATVFANLTWYGSTKDLVPLFDPKVHLFENSLLKILAPLVWELRRIGTGCPALILYVSKDKKMKLFILRRNWTLSWGAYPKRRIYLNCRLSNEILINLSCLLMVYF